MATKAFWAGVIHGEPASKANSRRLVRGRGRLRPIKSAKALAYVESARIQVMFLRPKKLLAGRLRLEATLYYASKRPDLDPSLILDVLQGLIYANDRQVREMHIFHRIDKSRPRAVLAVEEIDE